MIIFHSLFIKDCSIHYPDVQAKYLMIPPVPLAVILCSTFVFRLMISTVILLVPTNLMLFVLQI